MTLNTASKKVPLMIVNTVSGDTCVAVGCYGFALPVCRVHFQMGKYNWADCGLERVARGHRMVLVRWFGGGFAREVVWWRVVSEVVCRRVCE